MKQSNWWRWERHASSARRVIRTAPHPGGRPSLRSCTRPRSPTGFGGRARTTTRRRRCARCMRARPRHECSGGREGRGYPRVPEHREGRVPLRRAVRRKAPSIQGGRKVANLAGASAGSYGFQAGVQAFGYAMSPDDELGPTVSEHESGGWEGWDVKARSLVQSSTLGSSQGSHDDHGPERHLHLRLRPEEGADEAGSKNAGGSQKIHGVNH